MLDPVEVGYGGLYIIIFLIIIWIARPYLY